MTFAGTTLSPQLITSVGGDDGIVSGNRDDDCWCGEAGEQSLPVDEILFGEVTADADGNFVYELTAENLSSLEEGENKAIRATQTDAAGNQKPRSC